MNNFFYQKGVLKITTPWERPSNKLFIEWLNKIMPIANSLNYNLWLVGNFLINPKLTWDIDIIVTKNNKLKPSEYDSLSNFMIKSCKEGHKLKLLIDMQFYVNFEGKSFSKDGIKSFWHSYNDYIKGGTKRVKKICFFNYFIKNEKIITDWRKNSKKISSNLYLIKKISSSKKLLDRIKKRIYYSDPVNLKEIYF